MEAASAPIHAFLQFLLISAAHNILTKAVAAFLITNVLTKFSIKTYHNDYHQSKDKLEIWV